MHWFIIWSSFIAPSWSEYCLFSFSGSTVLPPGGQLFKECQGFCKLDRYSSCLTIFLFWNQLSYFQRSCQFKSNCWNEIREMSVFENQVSSVKDPTHVIRNIQSFDCHVFWKQKLTHCKFKMTFSMVLYVSFNLWSWVYLFTVCNEVTFCEFQETKGSSQNLRIHQERLFSFLAPILSACIITSSLIHEVTTLMEQLFNFKIAIYRFRLLTWLKRAFKSM